MRLIPLPALAAVVAILACGVEPPSDGSETTSDPIGPTPSATAFLRAHNAVRASVGASLPVLQWSIDLGGAARAWADQCTWGPDPALAGANLGQNLAWAPIGTTPPKAVVDAWAAEAASYDPAANTCSAATCAHYTQIVWRATTSLGCGIAACPGPAPDGSAGEWEYAVCAYSPRGNVEGEKPY